MRLEDALEEIRGELLAAGLRVAYDLSSLNPPAVLLGAPTLTFNRLDGRAYQADVPLWVVAPNTGRVASYGVLSALLAAVRPICTGLTAEPVELAPLDGGDPLPAYRMTITANVDED